MVREGIYCDEMAFETEIRKMMALEVFRLMLKHFRVVRPSSLPAVQSPESHPLQKIDAGVAYLHEKSLPFWSIMHDPMIQIMH